MCLAAVVFVSMKRTMATYYIWPNVDPMPPTCEVTPLVKQVKDGKTRTVAWLSGGLWIHPPFLLKDGTCWRRPRWHGLALRPGVGPFRPRRPAFLAASNKLLASSSGGKTTRSSPLSCSQGTVPKKKPTKKPGCKSAVKKRPAQKKKCRMERFVEDLAA